MTLYKNATGDTGVVKQMSIQNADGSVKNLAALSVSLVVWDGDPAQPLLTSANAVVDGLPTNGAVKWTVSLADVAALPVKPEGLKAAIRLYTGPIGSPTYQDTTDPFTIVVNATA